MRIMNRTISFLLVILLAALAGCTTVDADLGPAPGPEPVTDDRPLVTWNRLMNETLPVVTEALAEEGDDFYARGFVLSREGGVRSVHMSPSVGRDHAERVNLLFNSIEAMMAGDVIVAFVVFAPASGHLINRPEEDRLLVAHLEHLSGRALLRKFSYTRQGDDVELGAEEVDQVAPVIFQPQ